MKHLLTAEDRALIERAKAIQARVRKALRQARPKPVNPTAEGQRQVRQQEPGFLAYLRRLPCEARHLGGCEGPIEAAHIRYSDARAGSINPGMQRKNHDRHANPLCHFHHQHDQHRRRERDFWSSLGKDAYATAAQHHADYAGKQADGAPPLHPPRINK